MGGGYSTAYPQSLERVRAATGRQPELYVGSRHCCYGCAKLWLAGAPCFVCAGRVGEGGGGPVGLFCVVLGLVSVGAYWPFCAARQREVDSFSVVVTPALVASSHEEVGWDLCGGPGRPVVAVVEGARLADAQVGCCAPCAPCGAADAQLFFRDAATGGRRTTDCCGSRCPAGPDVTYRCVRDARGLVAAINDGPVAAARGAAVAVASPVPPPGGHANYGTGGAGAAPYYPGAPTAPPPAAAAGAYYAAQSPPPGYYGGGAKTAY